MATKTGRNELRTTNEDPRQVTPITTKIEPMIYMDGAISTKSMLVAEPINPKDSSNVFRLLSMVVKKDQGLVVH